jgi:hypothetical protein
MSYYEELIIKSTGCKPEEAAEVEGTMRDVILHSTLDWLSKEKFKKAAIEAYEFVLYVNSPEGMAHMMSIKRDMQFVPVSKFSK